MQCNSTRFTTGNLLSFLGFIKNYPACRPAACKKFQQSQLGLLNSIFFYLGENNFSEGLKTKVRLLREVNQNACTNLT